MLKIALVSIYVCCAFSLDFELNVKQPLSFEDSLKSALVINCENVANLKSKNMRYKDSQAKARCEKEQTLLKAIMDDDINAYQAQLNGDYIKHFLLFSTNPPYVEITPLMASIAFNAKNVFKLIAQESGKITLLSRLFGKKPRYDINRVMYDEIASLGAFRQDYRIYDINGLSALDIAAIYHRYDMFYELLLAGADYYSHKHPQNSGIVSFGDMKIIDTMLKYDKQFLDNFSGGKILHLAARNGNIELIDYLITTKQMPIDLLKSGQTPLDEALSGKNFEHKPQLAAAYRLIALGAKVSKANANRLEALTSESASK